MVRPGLGGVPGSGDVLKLGIRGDLPHYLVFVGTDIVGFVNENDVEFTPTSAGAPAKYSVTVGGKTPDAEGNVTLP